MLVLLFNWLCSIYFVELFKYIHIFLLLGQQRLCFLEFLGYHDPYHPQSQATETDFSNAGSMLECGLVTEALDSIRSAVFPGLLPPVPYLRSLLEYAQQGNATSVFLRNFQQVLCNLLTTNPPWWAPSSVTKYFTQLLQCPPCGDTCCVAAGSLLHWLRRSAYVPITTTGMRRCSLFITVEDGQLINLITVEGSQTGS